MIVAAASLIAFCVVSSARYFSIFDKCVRIEVIVRDILLVAGHDRLQHGRDVIRRNEAIRLLFYNCEDLVPDQVALRHLSLSTARDTSEPGVIGRRVLGAVGLVADRIFPNRSSRPLLNRSASRWVKTSDIK